MNEYIQQIIDWIEENLINEFSLERLSSHMGYSPYYCSFKFHQATGVSIRRYILLRRLYLSTEDLANNRKIIDIAFDYNYSSQEAYSRAFKTVFGVSPREFQLNQMPVQSFAKLTIHQGEDGCRMIISRETEVEQLKNRKRELFDQDVLNILNGQVMYEEFKNKKLMGDSDYVPFNEAMCVKATTTPIFDNAFIQMRASEHKDSVENYSNMVIKPLNNLFKKNYNYIVLWFGEDMFCQMNLLTILAYLEQSQYKGKVVFNSFREDEFKVSQTELILGSYYSVYEEVLVNHMKPTNELLPVKYQAIDLFLEMQTENNAVTKYIAKNKHLPTSELLKRLFEVFSALGYGDSQYIELIDKTK
ncbi:AraC family transcriptional regulator [Paenibacillus chitinolyticus]|uniref:helix-turn-helix domain-containing protein n=1 Tax=Paenibacillus chitinolyticus TaxID=79263 RepID=UPI002DBFC771|nr:AraC family transcriptional regulator [Paenibacillus chitinolyticus]MEC0244560.1 AraC family transcriptional regulator [Paenibacillus chitinolyticus]